MAKNLAFISLLLYQNDDCNAGEHWPTVVNVLGLNPFKRLALPYTFFP